MAYTTDEKIDLLFETMAKTDQKINKLTDDIAEMRKSQTEMDRKFQEIIQDADRRIKKLEEMRWRLGLIQWDIAEDAIRRSISDNLLAY